MKGYRWLSRIYVLDQRILRKEARLEALRSCLFPSSMDYGQDRIQSTPTDKMAAITAEIIDLEAEIEQMKLRKYFLIDETEKMIDRLDNEVEKTVLAMYFISCRSMTEIADSIGYSVRHTYRFFDSGVAKVNDRL